MNSKLTKLFFVALTWGLSGKTIAQTDAERKQIIRQTNVEALQNFAKEKQAIFDRDYPRALEKAQALGIATSGVDKDGNYFELVGFIDGTEELKFYKTNGVNKVTFNNSSTGSSLKTVGALYLHDLGVTGQNMIAGEWDGGIPYAAHYDLTASRIVRKDTGAADATGTGVGVSHGTHVAGTIVSRGIGAPTTKGFLPDNSARLWANTWTNDVTEMTSQAAQGLLVSNHSYGINMDQLSSYGGVGYLGRYSTVARDMDFIANNAPYYLAVWAAGNDRGSYASYNPNKGGRDLLSSEGVAKNTVTVAAIVGIENYISANSVQISGFSNWGPSDDFRIKPDISAKGVNVISTINSSATASESNSGTSMAAPAITGAFSLWQQYHNQLKGGYMKSATVRALMAHTAKEAGPAAGPDYMYGWGVLDVEAGAKVIEGSVNYDGNHIFEYSLNNGETFEMDVTPSANKPLVVTIAWNDPAGPAMSGTDIQIPVLVNNLDLKIVNVNTNEVYYPWRLVRSWTTTGSGIAEKAENNADNIEKVEAGILPEGQYKIVVTHKGTLSGGSQLFSLIATGHQGALSNKTVELEGVAVYPNPASEVLNLDLPTTLTNAELSIFDLTGRKVKSVSNINAQTSVNISDLSAGVYMVKIEAEEGTKTLKIVKK